MTAYNTLLVNEYSTYLHFQAMQSAAGHAVHTLEARFCRWMLQRQDVLQSDIVGLTQESLAQMLGVQRTAVSLCANALQAAGADPVFAGLYQYFQSRGP